MTSRKNSKGSLVPVKIIPPTRSAYTYPLLIKHLLHSPMTRAPDQEIVYRDLRRRTYREFRERIGRLASGLTQIGVDQGDVVAILEWDSDRYHECYFAIPMMGAVMQTVNVSLVPEDIAYTIIDSGATTVLFNADFLPLVEKLAPHLKAVKNYVLMHDRPEAQPTDFADQGRIRGAVVDQLALFPVPGLRRERGRHHFPHDGNDRPAERRLFQPSADGAAYADWTGGIWPSAWPRPLPSRRRLHADDADVPRARLGLPVHGDAVGRQARVPRPILARNLRQDDRHRRR